MATIIKSPAGNLISADWKSLGIGLLKTLAGALVVYLLTNLGQIDFGQYAIFAVPFITAILNAIYKWATGSVYVK